MSQTVTLLGASGLVGGQILDLLLEDPLYSSVKAIVRRPLERSHPKLEQVLIDFSDITALEQAIAGSETVFCAVGTTNRKVGGDQEAYRKVDFDIPVHAAKACAKYGVYGFVMVSSVGADPNNNDNFYLKLKGVTEEAVSKEFIPLVVIFRPSLLLGKREERRMGERMAQALAPVFSFLLPASKKKYKPVDAAVVATAMVKASQQMPKGIHFIEYEQIMTLGGAS
jgi:uncharacterized protein YbjT (DUF2867 family)